MYCTSCRTEIPEGAKFCPNCGAATEQSPQEQPQIPAKKKKAPLLIAIVAICVIAAIVIFAVNGNQTRERAEYINNLESFKIAALGGAAKAESACNLTYKVWYDTIYENYRSETAPYTRSGGVYHDDFNDSLRALYASEEMETLVSEIRSNQKTVEEYYKLLQNPSEEFTVCFEAVDDLYGAYYRLTSLAVSPTGSLRSYSDDFSSYDSEFGEYYDKLDLLIPEQ